MLTMKNMELFLQGYSEQMETIGYNTNGAANNSYWALLAFIPFGALLLGLTVFCVVMFIRLETKLNR